jgi:hypothetical protein
MAVSVSCNVDSFQRDQTMTRPIRVDILVAGDGKATLARSQHFPMRNMVNYTTSASTDSTFILLHESNRGSKITSQSPKKARVKDEKVGSDISRLVFPGRWQGWSSQSHRIYQPQRIAFQHHPIPVRRIPYPLTKKSRASLLIASVTSLEHLSGLRITGSGKSTLASFDQGPKCQQST